MEIAGDGRNEQRDGTDDRTGPAWHAARDLHAGMKAAGVDFAVYLPDSVLYRAMRLLDEDPEVTSVVCAREDEGVALAVGASLAGRLPVVLMEGSGLGYCGLILSRALIHRTSLLVIGSHTPLLGERFDFHASSRIAGAAAFDGLHIPYQTVTGSGTIGAFARQALETARSQRIVVGLLVPPFVMSGG